MVQFTWRFVFGICTYIWYTYFFNSESGEQNRKALQAWWDNLTMDAVIGYADVAWESSAGLFWKLWEQGFEGLLEWGDERLIKICFAALAFKALGIFFRKRMERNEAKAQAGPAPPPKQKKSKKA